MMGQAKARHEAFPDRFFNVGFAIDPNGEVVLKHYKLATLYPVEHSVTPHDVWDRWIELYGRRWTPSIRSPTRRSDGSAS